MQKQDSKKVQGDICMIDTCSNNGFTKKLTPINDLISQKPDGQQILSQGDKKIQSAVASIKGNHQITLQTDQVQKIASDD